MTEPAYINVVFNGPPDPYRPFTLIEVETDDGRSLKAGEWMPHRGDTSNGWWSLRIPYRAPADPIEVPDHFEPKAEDLIVKVVGDERRGYFVSITYKPTGLQAADHGATEERARETAMAALLNNARIAAKRMSSLKGNPVLRQVYRHNDEPDTVWGVFTDSKGNAHRVPVHRGDVLFPILMDRYEGLDDRVEEIRRELGNTP